MSLLNDLRSIIPEAGPRMAADVLMASHSTFQIGGPADIYFEPSNADEIECVARFCRDRAIPLTVLGNGSNVLISDRGIRGVVIAIADRMSEISISGTMLLAQAGARLSSIAAAAAQNSLTGLEFASGIPGTLGGAILMNAGAYGQCMADVVVLTEFLDDKMERKTFVGPEHRFDYRSSAFSEQPGIVLRSCIKLSLDDPQAILARMADLAARRRASQPLDQPSAGSTFKRPPGNYAGKLISECGLKGCRVGNAQVSEKHAGFIINLGLGNAVDIRTLLERVKLEVAEKTGVWLEPEVRFIGDWQDWDTTPPLKE